MVPVSLTSEGTKIYRQTFYGFTMKLSATLIDGTTRLRALLDHPMESGMRRDSLGTVITANFIRKVEVKLGERQLFTSDWGGNLSKNPYFSIEFEGAQVEDVLTIEWQDNEGGSRSHTVTVQAAN